MRDRVRGPQRYADLRTVGGSDEGKAHPGQLGEAGVTEPNGCGARRVEDQLR